VLFDALTDGDTLALYEIEDEEDTDVDSVGLGAVNPLTEGEMLALYDIDGEGDNRHGFRSVWAGRPAN
jgi:hypothetical protein